MRDSDSGIGIDSDSGIGIDSGITLIISHETVVLSKTKQAICSGLEKQIPLDYSGF